MNIDDIRGRATISVPEAGELLGLGSHGAYRAAHEGTIPTLKYGRALRVPVHTFLQTLGVDSEKNVTTGTGIDDSRLTMAEAQAEILVKTIRKVVAQILRAWPAEPDEQEVTALLRVQAQRAARLVGIRMNEKPIEAIDREIRETEEQLRKMRAMRDQLGGDTQQ